MADDDPARRSTSMKVVITGPYGAGKTTLVRTLSEITVLTTERRVASADSQGEATTVAMDFGRLTVGPDMVLYLFGTAARQQFDFMWEILAEGMLGFMVVIDHERPDSLAEAGEILAYLEENADLPYVVVVNKVQPGMEQRAEKLARHALRLGDEVRVVAADVREPGDARKVLVEVLTAAREHALGNETASV